MPNPYEKRNWTEAMPIDKDHAIRFISRNWKGQDLTQEQWNEICPRIVKMLQQDCDMRADHQNYGFFGPSEVHSFVNVQDAIKALDHQVDIDGKDWLDPNLPGPIKKHIYALEWAFQNLMMNNEVLESRIKKIIGAALTCEIQHAETIGHLCPTPNDDDGKPSAVKKHKPNNNNKDADGASDVSLGVAVIKFSEVEGNKILTQCMKAYRVLDEVACWDINGFLDNDCHLWKMIEGRNYLACCAMIDMQVKPWLAKAKQHLSDIGLQGVEALLLGEADILSRSVLLNGAGQGELSQYINAITSKLPKAFADNGDEATDVGFATAGGKVLAKLAPLMFASAQIVNDGKWQLVQNEYHSVWLTVGDAAYYFPLKKASGLLLLKAFQICEQNLDPFKLSLIQ